MSKSGKASRKKAAHRGMRREKGATGKAQETAEAVQEKMWEWERVKPGKERKEMRGKYGGEGKC